MFPPWNFLKITWTHLTRGAGIQGQAFNSTIIFLPLQSLLLLPGKMLRMWQFKGAVFKVSWTLYQLLAQHLCMWSGSSLLSLFSFPFLQLHLSESKQDRICMWTFHRAVHHQLTSRCWHCCCSHTWQRRLPVCLRVPCWSHSSAPTHIPALPRLLTLHLYAI